MSIQITHAGDPFPAIPAELKARPQWVVWRRGPTKPNGHFRKIPCDPATGQAADDQNPQIWRTYGQAVQLLQGQRFAGLGYVFTTDDPYVGVDLDHCYIQNQLDDQAAAIVVQLASYTEVSVSGQGVKIIIRATLAANPIGLPAGLEIYATQRFFALTGQHLAGTPSTIQNSQAALDAILVRYAPPERARRLHNAPERSPASDAIADNPITTYNAQMSALDVLDRNGGRPDGPKLYHCPCGVHRGQDGSLLVKRSARYGVVVRGLNAACAFYGTDAAAFDVMRRLEHHGDTKAAIAAARNELRMPIQRTPRTPQFAPKPPAPAAARQVTNAGGIMQQAITAAAKDCSLSRAERRVLATLIDHAAEGVARLTVAQIMRLTDLSESSVHRATTRLHGRYFHKHEDANQAGANIANLYQFVAVVTPPLCNENTASERPNAEIDTPLLNQEESKGGADGPAPAAQPQRRNLRELVARYRAGQFTPIDDERPSVEASQEAASTPAAAVAPPFLSLPAVAHDQAAPAAQMTPATPDGGQADDQAGGASFDPDVWAAFVAQAGTYSGIAYTKSQQQLERAYAHDRPIVVLSSPPPAPGAGRSAPVPVQVALADVPPADAAGDVAVFDELVVVRDIVRSLQKAAIKAKTDAGAWARYHREHRRLEQIERQMTRRQAGPATPRKRVRTEPQQTGLGLAAPPSMPL